MTPPAAFTPTKNTYSIEVLSSDCSYLQYSPDYTYQRHLRVPEILSGLIPEILSGLRKEIRSNGQEPSGNTVASSPL